jgi:hypothetical protein
MTNGWFWKILSWCGRFYLQSRLKAHRNQQAERSAVVWAVPMREPGLYTYAGRCVLPELGEVCQRMET